MRISLITLVCSLVTIVGCTNTCSERPITEFGNPKDKPSYSGISVGSVVKRDLLIGFGQEEVKTTNSIEYRQTTWIYDPKKPANRGQLVSSSPENEPPVSLDSGEVIRGIELGVLGMKKGGKRQLIIPPEQAYGDKGLSPHVFPGAILLVDIEIKDIN